MLFLEFDSLAQKRAQFLQLLVQFDCKIEYVDENMAVWVNDSGLRINLYSEPFDTDKTLCHDFMFDIYLNDIEVISSFEFGKPLVFCIS